MPRRTLQGVVVSDKQDKTVVVRVERRFTHPEMKKTVRSAKKYYAHDETNQYEVDGIPVQLAKEALGLAAAKLPIKTRFIQRITE